MDEHIGAAPHQRSEQRTTMRNGYKPRQLTTRVGTIELLVPQARDGSFSTVLFDRYQRSEKALVLSLMQMYLQGVSTRKVAAITEELCGTSFSSATVSRLCSQLDAELKAWKSRPLDETPYPYLYTDATFIPSHDGPIVRKIPVLITCGVRAIDGKREILDVRSAPTESEDTYRTIFASLIERGLRGVRLVIGDDHLGLVQAAAIHFPGAAFQRCLAHYQRNAMGKVSKKDRAELAGGLRRVWDMPEREDAVAAARDLCGQWAPRSAELAAWMEDSIWQTLNFYAFPPTHRRRIRTNNLVERVNGEIKRRTNVVRIFPNPDSVIRLAGSLAMQISEKWETGPTYLDMDDLTEWDKENTNTTTSTPPTTIHAIS